MWLIFLCLTAILAYCYKLLRQYKNYWQNLGIASAKPSIYVGNICGPGHFLDFLQKCYDKFSKSNTPLVGFHWFFKPVVFVTDPAVLKLILIKDFPKFADHGVFVNEKDDPLSGLLFNLRGNKWRNMRHKLTPTFTSGKMKIMFPIIRNISHELVSVLEETVKENEIIEVADFTARFTSDVICSCAFGLDISSLKDSKSKFRIMACKALKEQRFGKVFRQAFPELAIKLHMKHTTPEVEEFFMGAVKETVRYREENNVRRNDFMDMLIDLKNNKLMKSETNEEEFINLTIEEIAAQALTCLLAGFETSSTTMAAALYELAKHEDIQDKARQEVLQVLQKHNQEYTYEAIKDMLYLEQILLETLRLHTIIPFVPRQASEDYPVPGYPKTVIKKDMTVLIPITHIHHDERYYPNPNQFNPDNFTAEKVAQRDSVLYLPFSEGPRRCIGVRFGKLEAVMGLAVLVQNFKFSVCEKTRFGLIFDRLHFLGNFEHGVHLKIKKI